MSERRAVVNTSKARAKAAGAYDVELLNPPEGFLVCIKKGERMLAVPSTEATAGEILGMAAAPALARAVSAFLLADTDEKRFAAVTKGRMALWAAGVPMEGLG